MSTIHFHKNARGRLKKGSLSIRDRLLSAQDDEYLDEPIESVVMDMEGKELGRYTDTQRNPWCVKGELCMSEEDEIHFEFLLRVCKLYPPHEQLDVFFALQNQLAGVPVLKKTDKNRQFKPWSDWMEIYK